MSSSEKEAFRLAWAEKKHAQVTSTKTSSSSRSDAATSAKSYMSLKQLITHYKGRKAAQNHVAFCRARSDPGWVLQNAMSGEEEFLVISWQQKNKATKSWELSEEAKVDASAVDPQS